MGDVNSFIFSMLDDLNLEHSLKVFVSQYGHTFRPLFCSCAFLKDYKFSVGLIIDIELLISNEDISWFI